jgi:hypothetical protein
LTCHSPVSFFFARLARAAPVRELIRWQSERFRLLANFTLQGALGVILVARRPAGTD